MNIAKYFTENKEESSVLKNIPIEHLKEVQKEIGTMIKVVNHYSSICKVRARYVFRGPREKFTPYYDPNKKVWASSTIKKNANRVSVYFDVKTTCPGLSHECRKVLKETVERNFVEILKKTAPKNKK